jgi:hypothetical protein
MQYVEAGGFEKHQQYNHNYLRYCDGEEYLIILLNTYHCGVYHVNQGHVLLFVD